MILDLIRSSLSFPLSLLVIYFVGTMLSIAGYVAYFRYHEARYGRDLVQSFLAFTVTGTVTYAVFSAVFWVWAVRYTTDENLRVRRVGYGLMGIFLMHDLPLFVIQSHAVLCCGGLHHGLQGTVYVFQWLEFLISFTFAWQSYTWIVAEFLNDQYGDPYGTGLKTGTDRVAVFPSSENGGTSRGSKNELRLPPVSTAGYRSSPPSRGGSELNTPLLRDDGVDFSKPPEAQRQAFGRRSSGQFFDYRDGPGSRSPRRDSPRDLRGVMSGVNYDHYDNYDHDVPIEDPMYRGPSMGSSQRGVDPGAFSGGRASSRSSAAPFNSHEMGYVAPGRGSIYLERR